MKQFLFAIALLAFFAVPVSAFLIAAPEKTVASSNWSFVVEFELGDSFQSAVISLDDKRVLTMYSDYRNFIFDPSRIIKADGSVLDRKLFVSAASLDAGDHSILVETFNDAGVVLASKTQPFSTIDPLSSVTGQGMNADLNALWSQNDSLAQQLQQVQQANSELEKKIADQKQQIEQQNTEIQKLSQLVDWLQQNQNSTTQFNESVSKQVQGFESRLSEQEQKLQSSQGGFSLSGLATSRMGMPLATILGLLILVVIVGYTVFRHVREKKLY